MNDSLVTSKTTGRFVYIFFGILAGLMVLWIAYMAITGNEWGTVRQGEAETYTVRIADNPIEWAKGLSGTKASDLGDAIGLLFVYGKAEERTFWMKGMNYNLDILWIKEGRVMKIDYNVPAPAAGQEPISVMSDPLLVDMVLEMPAGGADRVGYLAGHQLYFDLDAPAQN